MNSQNPQPSTPAPGLHLLGDLHAMRRPPSQAFAWASSLLLIGLIGTVDYASGTEIRTYPLYYGPIGLLAWQAGRRGAVTGAVLCAVSWLISNTVAGLHYSHPAIIVVNTAVNGASFLFVGLLIAELNAALDRSRTLSRTDPLTSLRNARAFLEDSAPLLALCRRTDRPLTVAYLDLDHFKEVNDSHGHHAGDVLLKAVATAIHDALRPSDLCARLGGDEFAVLLPELGERDADLALQRILETVRTAAGSASRVTASIGAVTFLVPPEDMNALIQQADSQMYRAKSAGRNRVTRVVVSAAGAIDAS